MSKKSSKRNKTINPVAAKSRTWLSFGVIAALAIAIFAAVMSGQQSANPASTTNDAPAVQEISPDAYNTQFASTDHVLIDVRTREEFASGHIEGAINIPVEEIGQRLSEVPQDQTVVLYCRSGNRSAQAANILERAGYDGIYDLGGIIAWTNAGYPVR